MPFAVIGYFLGIAQEGYSFDVTLFLKVILCMIFARTAAMAFNRYIDRSLDSKNDRTKEKTNLGMGDRGTDKKRKKTIKIFFRKVEMNC